MTKKCSMCGKIFTGKPAQKYCSKQCFGVSIRGRRGKNHPTWKGGKPNCPICGVQLTTYQSKRCWGCYSKDPVLAKRSRARILKSGSPNYIDGRTPITSAIRALPELTKWRTDVFTKYNYSCADCGSRGYLEAHHITAFNKLFKDFINTYNQFSVIDDKETLTRLAVNYKPFFDVSNGKALCKDCHEKYRIEARRDTQKTPESFLVFEIPSKEASNIPDQTL